MCYTYGYNLIHKNLTAATWPSLLIFSQSTENLKDFNCTVGNKRQDCFSIFLMCIVRHQSKL